METDGELDRGRQPLQGGAEVIRLRPLRVLIVSSDHRFRAVIAMLITRRGCSAFSVSAAEHVAEMLVRERVDVALVDGIALLRELVAQSDATAPPVGIVLVGERAEPALAGMLSLAKWGTFEELFAAIVDADRARSRPGKQALRPG